MSNENSVKSKKYLVALSGGADSIAVLKLLHDTYPGNIAACHVHHGLQAVADSWVDFCKEICSSYDIPLDVHFVQVDQTHASGTEAHARSLRYNCLKQACEKYGSTVVATGHHIDDNEETILFQFLRGTGLKGMTGLKVYSHLKEYGLTLYRPLIERKWTKAMVTNWCLEQQLKWVEDPTNTCSDEYSRNFLRLEIIPLLKKRFKTFSSAIERFSSVATDALLLMDQLAKEDFEKSCKQGINYKQENGFLLDCKFILTKDLSRQRNLLRYLMAINSSDMLYEDRQLQEWLKRLKTPTPKNWEHGGYAFEYKKQVLRVFKK